jgi:hypothetical protein
MIAKPLLSMFFASSRPSRRRNSETASVSSTVTGEQSGQKQLISPSVVETSSGSKKVSFSLKKNERHTNTQLYKDEVVDLWYTAQDFNRFRRQITIFIQAMSRQAGKGNYDTVITRTYAACCEENARVLFCSEAQGLLIHCMDAKLLGLDKYAVEAVREHRSERRTVIRDAVLFVQDETNGNCEIIRQKSESISLATRLYARTLAVAVEREIRR